jgi:hypothetical protein
MSDEDEPPPLDGYNETPASYMDSTNNPLIVGRNYTLKLKNDFLQRSQNNEEWRQAMGMDRDVKILKIEKDFRDDMVDVFFQFVNPDGDTKWAGGYYVFVPIPTQGGKRSKRRKKRRRTRKKRFQ